jgi:hypothetical protein
MAAQLKGAAEGRQGVFGKRVGVTPVGENTGSQGKDISGVNHRLASLPVVLEYCSESWGWTSIKVFSGMGLAALPCPYNGFFLNNGSSRAVQRFHPHDSEHYVILAEK